MWSYMFGMALLINRFPHHTRMIKFIKEIAPHQAGTFPDINSDAFRAAYICSLSPGLFIQTGKFTLVKAAGQARFALVMDHIATGDGVGDEKQETGEGKETEDVKEKAEGEGKDIEDVKEETEREGKEENRDEPKGAKSKEEGDQAHKKVNRIRNKNTPNGHQAGRRRVQEAVKAISQAEFSVFSYAILSGHMNAVQFIYNLIIDLFPYKSREVREFTGNRCSQFIMYWHC